MSSEKTNKDEETTGSSATPSVGVTDSYAVCFRGRHLQMIRAERVRLEASLLGREVTDADAARSLVERASAMLSDAVKAPPRDARVWTAEEIARVVYERAVVEAEDFARPFLCTSIEVRAALKIPEGVSGQTIADAIRDLARYCPDANVSAVGQKKHPCGTYVLWMIQAKPRPAAQRAKTEAPKPTAPKTEEATDAPTSLFDDEWSEERIAAAVHGLARSFSQPVIVSVTTVMESLKIPPSVSRNVVWSAIERIGTYHPGARAVLIAGRRAGAGRGNIDMWSVSPSSKIDAPKQPSLLG
jgi:hypothetical protein